MLAGWKEENPPINGEERGDIPYCTKENRYE
jgi:hypothetical protein